MRSRAISLTIRSSYLEPSLCEGQSLLPLLYPDKGYKALWFMLGHVVHQAIHEFVKVEDSEDPKDLRSLGQEILEHRLEEAGDQLITPFPPAKPRRSIHTVHDDVDKALRTWFHYVHPAGRQQHLSYAPLKWPPFMEVRLKADTLQQEAQPADRCAYQFLRCSDRGVENRRLPARPVLPSCGGAERLEKAERSIQTSGEGIP